MIQKKVFCRTCKTVTNHQILSQHNKKEDDDEHGITFWTDSFFLQCRGCESICFIFENACSEDFNPETGELETTTLIFPNPYVLRSKVDGFYLLPNAIQQIYEECVASFNNKLPILTAIGLRLIIESICKDKGINDGDLYHKINQMAAKGFITESQKSGLHIIRTVGNDSAHEGRVLSNEQLNIVFDIVENALSNAYIIPKKFEQFSKFYTRIDVNLDREIT